MTLHQFSELEQGSPEWHDVRRGMITASVVGKLITTKTFKPASNDESRNLTKLLAAERITGWTDPTFMNDDMWRGVECEPIARDFYSEKYAPVTEVGFMVLETDRYKLGYSPDGLVGDDGLIEVKSPRAKGHLSTIVAGTPPIVYMAQMQCGMLVSGRKWCDYVSWYGGMPMFVHRVYPDQKWLDAIHEAVIAFEDNVAETISIYQNAIADLHPTERSPIETAELRLA